MKNLYQQRMVRLMAACLLLPASLQAQTATVYTPRGTAVTADIYAEWSPQDIAYINQQTDAQYPSAQRIGDASRRYNCHAYAWYLSEAPGSTPYWIEGGGNNPGDDKYWQDGSYIQICNESEAAKISYPSGDHSATRSPIAGKVDSKWGNTPLMRHDPGYAPSIYNPSIRTYYVPTKISGRTSICNSESFSVASFTGGTYVWSASSNITLNSTSGPSVTATNNGSALGPGWVEVVIMSACSGSSVKSHLNVTTFGAPNFYNGNINYDGQQIPLGGSNGVGEYSTIQFPSEAFTTYTFQQVGGGYAYIVRDYDNECDLYVPYYATDGLRVLITKTNPCGTVSQEFYFEPNYYYRYSPNPASSEILVEAMTGKGSNSKAATRIPAFDATLYDNFGHQVKVQRSAQGQAKLDVRSIPNGLYNLRVGQGKNAVFEHIQITH